MGEWLYCLLELDYRQCTAVHSCATWMRAAFLLMQWILFRGKKCEVVDELLHISFTALRGNVRGAHTVGRAGAGTGDESVDASMENRLLVHERIMENHSCHSCPRRRYP